MQRRSLIVIIATLIALSVVVFVSGRLHAPESDNNQSGRLKDGDVVSMRGEMVCLQHVDQEGPTTMECAYGFHHTDTGVYYAVEDASEGYSIISSVPMNQPVQIEGVYRANPDTKYIQSGTIQATSITE